MNPDHQSDHTLPTLSALQAQRLIERLDDIPLYAHAYSFHLNFRYHRVGVDDLLQFSHDNGLKGIKVHLDDGEQLSLRHQSDAQLAQLKVLALALKQDIHLEISATDIPELSEAVRIGRQLGATSIRCYPRYAGRVSEIIDWTIRDLSQLSQLDPQGQFRFTVEQHEDLTGKELARIIEAVDNPNLHLLFDFCNMFNAYEMPLDALRDMAPHITDVHIKDAVRVIEQGGWGQKGCRSGEGEIPQARLLLELLLLGKAQPQVVAFGLEEEVDFYAPPMRVAGEPDDPQIPYREASMTEIAPETSLDQLLAREQQDARDQLSHVMNLLAQIRQHAQSFL
ncbi:sugar phosphate isomerase/epimerase family protein [Photobacterium sp. TY1-4]|uniref:sugar phosphate isomerase/epimerase family protein n=1 Tax=Photobacterium sp. TY1-4 TaxID=2899122 RepID=UPI0021C0FF8B|nr:sugar phosphate isomerase/epimerase [Photobacterium sp. TY1-4]UXI04469.1 sugar phosphate isomerase/epimerase [Photobacterium sp. TY1-4]